MLVKTPFIFSFIISWFIFGCTENRAETPTMEKLYEIKTNTVSPNGNEPNSMVITIVPASGYKWNKEFKSTLIISDMSDIELQKKEFAKEDFKATDSNAELVVPFKAAKAGKWTMKAKANFSVCNDKVCRILRNQELQWDLEVK